MAERTEEDKILQTGIVVKLGGQDYEILPLVMKYSIPWRKKLASLFASLPKYINAKSDNPDEFAVAMQGIMSEAPDRILDLFFEYARGLDRKGLEEVVTETEVVKAFYQVLQLALSPFAQALPLVGRETQGNHQSEQPLKP